MARRASSAVLLVLALARPAWAEGEDAPAADGDVAGDDARPAADQPRPVAPPAPTEPELAAEPPPPHPKTPFDRGKVGISIAGGSSSNLGAKYFGIGAGVGYFVLDGVELGLSGLYSFGDGPDISKLAPSLRYVAQPLVGTFPLIPYVGGFYNHWFIGSGYSDVDTVGTRGGLLYVSGNMVLGLGVIYETIVSECVAECSSIYPDFTIALSF